MMFFLVSDLIMTHYGLCSQKRSLMLQRDGVGSAMEMDEGLIVERFLYYGDVSQ